MQWLWFWSLLAGCGGDDQPDAAESGSPAREIAGDADPAAVEVIDEWSTTLRQGDLEAAAGFFAIPSVAENGPTLIPIEDRGDARVFNASLPCGARLIRAEEEGEFTVATFRLTERPGPGTCGSGTGSHRADRVRDLGRRDRRVATRRGGRRAGPEPLYVAKNRYGIAARRRMRIVFASAVTAACNRERRKFLWEG